MSAPHVPCRSEPVSFLRLERYLLGELAERERVLVETHLGECEACRACMGELREDELELAPLPPGLSNNANVTAIARARRVPLMAAAGSALALAAAALLVLHAPFKRPPSAPGHTHIKGGELALSLVREHGGDIMNDPRKFAVGDRFEASLSCPPTTARMYWELVIFQGGKAFFPLSAGGGGASLSCANHVALPGAFSLDGDDSAKVCVVTNDREPVARASLNENALPEGSVCVTLATAQR